VATSISVGSILPSDLVVKLHPTGQPVIRGRPSERAVIAVTDGQETTGPKDPTHLDQSSDRVHEMLENLMRVDDIKTVVGKVQ
jgi:hypothetical protein